MAKAVNSHQAVSKGSGSLTSYVESTLSYLFLQEGGPRCVLKGRACLLKLTLNTMFSRREEGKFPPSRPPPPAKYDKGLCSHFCRLTFWLGYSTQNLLFLHALFLFLSHPECYNYIYGRYQHEHFLFRSGSYQVSNWTLFLVISYFYLNLLESSVQTAVRTQVVRIFFHTEIEPNASIYK